MSRQRKFPVAVAALLVCAVAGPAAAGEPGEAPPSIRKAPRVEQPASTAKQLPRSLAQALRREPLRLATTQWPDGTVAADLGGGYLNVWIARVNPDGTVSHACVTSPAEAEAALAGSAVEVK